MEAIFGRECCFNFVTCIMYAIGFPNRNCAILFVGGPARNPDDMDQRLYRGANKR